MRRTIRGTVLGPDGKPAEGSDGVLDRASEYNPLPYVALPKDQESSPIASYRDLGKGGGRRQGRVFLDRRL